MDTTDQQTALDRYLEYVDQVHRAERGTDADGQLYMSLHELYESKVWVEEWLQQSPPPKKPSNNWTPDSKSRFSSWLRWKTEQQGRDALSYNYNYRLLNAAEIVLHIPTFANGKSRTLPTEGALRPLGWFVRNRYEDRLADAMQLAIEQAGSADAVTSATTREAVKTWKTTYLSGRRGGKSPSTLNAVAKAHREHKKALEAIAKCYEYANINEDARAEFMQLRQDIIDYFTRISDQGEAA